MRRKVLEFWGKKYLIEMDSEELRIYDLDKVVSSLMMLMEMRIPFKIISLNNLKNVKMINSKLIEIAWGEVGENGIVYKLDRMIIEFNENEAGRFYGAMKDYLKRINFDLIFEKYKVKPRPGEVIRDDEIVIIFRDDHNTATLMDPEIYEGLYEEEKIRKSFFRRIYGFIFRFAPRVPYSGIRNIFYFDVIRIDDPIKIKDKYKVKVILVDDIVNVKFKSYGNALKFKQMLSIKASRIPKRKPRKYAGKILAPGMFMFLFSYWFLTNILRFESRIASLYSLIIGLITIVILWLILKSLKY